MVKNNRKICRHQMGRGLIKGINLDDNIDKIVNFNPMVVHLVLK